MARPPAGLRSIDLTVPLQYVHGGAFGRGFKNEELRYLTYSGENIWAYEGAAEDFLNVMIINCIALGHIISVDDFQREMTKFLNATYLYLGDSIPVIRALFDPKTLTAFDKTATTLTVLLEFLNQQREAEFKGFETKRKAAEDAGTRDQELEMELLRAIPHRQTILIFRYENLSKDQPALLNFAHSLVKASSPPITYTPVPSTQGSSPQAQGAARNGSKSNTTTKYNNTGPSIAELEQRFEQTLRSSAAAFSQLHAQLDELKLGLTEASGKNGALESENGFLKRKIADTAGGDGIKQQHDFVSLGNGDDMSERLAALEGKFH